MHQLFLLRHGENVWNKENLFTGWTDVDLSERGREESSQAGRSLREKGCSFDVAYTSVLKPAIRTLWIVPDEMDRMWVSVCNDWRLNERHFGALQGPRPWGDTPRGTGEAVAAQLPCPTARAGRE